MGFVQVLSPIDWITRIMFGIIGLIITGSLLRAELIKRKSKTLEFQDQYLLYSSLSCLWFGVICSLLLILSAVPGFCMMQLIGSATIYTFQFLFLGLYQLSRLHYSFSKEQLHQKKGYPLWVFKVMIAVGILVWIGQSFGFFMVLTPVAKCGYKENGYFFYEYRERAIIIDGDYYTDRDAANTFYTVWFTLTLIVGLWDLTTLLLYLWKIWKIGIIHKSKVDGVWDNVLFILQRIVILTVFYQFCHHITGILFPLMRYCDEVKCMHILAGNVLHHYIDCMVIIQPKFARTFPALRYMTLSPDMEAAVAIHRAAAILMVSSAVDSLAIYMMMEHNTNTYVCFLRFLRGFRLKYCCFCCWHRMVDRQLEELDVPEVEISAENTEGKDSEENPVSPTNQTVFSNISKGEVYGLNVCSRNLSISTRNTTLQNPDAFVFHLPSIRNIAKIEQSEETEYYISDAPE